MLAHLKNELMLYFQNDKYSLFYRVFLRELLERHDMLRVWVIYCGVTNFY